MTDELLLVWWYCAMLMLSRGMIEEDQGFLMHHWIWNMTIIVEIKKYENIITLIHVLGCPDGWLEGCPLG